MWLDHDPLNFISWIYIYIYSIVYLSHPAQDVLRYELVYGFTDNLTGTDGDPIKTRCAPPQKKPYLNKSRALHLRDKAYSMTISTIKPLEAVQHACAITINIPTNINRSLLFTCLLLYWNENSGVSSHCKHFYLMLIWTDILNSALV